MRRCGAIVGLLGGWVALLGGQGQLPAFRADAESVTVNVSVKRGNNPIPGLTAEDFRLYDNDVPQRVAAVSVESVALDVSFVVDMSFSTFPDRDTARDAVRRMAGFLRPTDRFRVLTMGNAVINAIPWQRAGPPDTSRIQEVMGSMSLVGDSVLVALPHRTEPDRRHLIVALTDGQDFCSLASGDTVRKSAERTDAVFHWVNLRLGGRPRGYAAYNGVESACRNNRGIPTEIGSSLSDAARLTGGSVHNAWSVADTSAIAGFFDAILDDFRRSYILHYVPDGVSRGGWHRLRVELPKRGKGYTVRTRPGYWGAANASATTPSTR